MALKISRLCRYMIFMLVLVVSGSVGCESTYAADEVDLDDFIKGVSRRVQERFKVKDIVVGNVSVKHFFQPIKTRELSLEYYWFPKVDINLILTDPRNVNDLRLKLAETSAENRFIKVILIDDRDTFLKKIWGFRDESLYEQTIIVPVTTKVSVCDEVTVLIYREINSELKQKFEEEEVQGKTDKHIKLDQVFDLLLKNKIEPFIRRMDPVLQKDPCFETFQLLKWLRREDIPGFAYREYQISDDLIRLLEPVSKSITETISRDEYNLTVQLVGHTDRALVGETGIPVKLSMTGIDDWSAIESPLEIYYSGCDDNYMSGDKPYFVDYSDPSGETVETIRNNCELSAVRAYITTVYFINKIGRNKVKYSYAAGGIYRAANEKNTKADSDSRRVDIEFLIKTADSSKK